MRKVPVSIAQFEFESFDEVVLAITSVCVEPERRASACYCAGKLRTHEFLKPLVLALNDGNQLVSFAAGTALSMIKSRKVTRDLIRTIRNGGKGHNRYSAIRVFMGFSDLRARSILISVVDNIGEDAQTRGLAAEVLGHLPPTAHSVDSLVKAMGDTDPSVRFGALCGVGGFVGRPLDNVVRAVEGLLNDECQGSGSETIGQRARLVLQSFQHFPRRELWVSPRK